MTPKFKPGDKVIFIFQNDEHKSWEVSNEEVESVVLYVDKIEYYLKDDGDARSEYQLFTKEAAIKFLQENLNDK